MRPLADGNAQALIHAKCLSDRISVNLEIILRDLFDILRALLIQFPISAIY
jgi:hypothetical protein